MLLADFKCAVKAEERNSKSGASSGFVEWVNQRGLIDLGFSGPRYTWNHEMDIQTRRFARLGRGLCDVEWRKFSQTVTVQHLTHSHSDHCPIQLSLEPDKDSRLGSRPFISYSIWMLH